MYPRFRCSVYGGTNWSWRDHPNFNVRENIKPHTLATGTTNELQEFVMKFIPKSRDLNKLLWKICLFMDLMKERLANLLIEWTNDDNYERIKPTKMFKEKASIRPLLLNFPAAINFFLLNIGLQMRIYNKELVYDFEISDISLMRKAFNNDLMGIFTFYDILFNSNFDLQVTIIYRAIRRYFVEIDRVLDDELMLYIPISMRSSENRSINIVSLFSPLKDLNMQKELKQVHEGIYQLQEDKIASIFSYLVEHRQNCRMFEFKSPNSQPSTKRFSMPCYRIIINVLGMLRLSILAGQQVEKAVIILPQPDPGSFGIIIIKYRKINVSVVNNKMPDYKYCISNRVVQLVNNEFET
ncbi:262_t:CDS:2 [Scutellospora calospora]|uniref:262_t:CDS:1 n=1 Tax=Scutellospora calospora TaxID=85575 RepID=A0ACA9JUE7_9GLOM|nr:262_t:CDS:2 [Scutellospora calospora]